jgi:CheY-like chemotaxis protein
MSEARPILVVDDDDQVREVVDLILSEAGYAVLSAQDGVAALKVLERERPSAILLDDRMPVMSGRQFAERYHTWPGEHAPIIAFTGLSAKLADLSYADGLLEKPFDIDDLLRVLGRYVPAN